MLNDPNPSRTRRYSRSSATALVGLVALSALLPAVGRASLIFVDTEVDEFSATTSGDAGCSLREAVHAANTNQLYGSCASGQSGEDIIFLPFEIGGGVALYDLTLIGDIHVTDDLQIWGTGAGQPQIHAQGSDRIFDVAASAETFTLLNLLLRGGNAGSGDGGAIRTHASVATVFDEVRFWDNQANRGGAIFVASSNTPAATVLDMTDVVFDDNIAGLAGGALHFSQSDATVTTSTCTDCTFEDNVAQSGGAIYLGGATRLTLFESTLTGNESANSSGTIQGSSSSWTTLVGSWVAFNDNGGNRGTAYRGSGVLILDDSTFQDGINLSGGTFEATDSTLLNTERTALYTSNESVVTLNRVRVAGSPWSVSENSAALRLDGPVLITSSIFENNGGGIECIQCDLTVSKSSFVDNIHDGDQGGAIYASGASAEVLVENSTFSGNAAREGGALWFSGGSHFELRNVTITGNSAEERGGGIFGYVLNTLPVLSNTIVAGNSATIMGPDCDSSLNSEGWNLIGIADECSVTATAGDLFGTGVAPIDAGLLPRALADTMPVHGLTQASPALDGGNPNPTGTSGSSCRPADQVGQVRPVDGGGGLACDIGAIEETSPGVSILFADGFETGDTSRW